MKLQTSSPWPGPIGLLTGTVFLSLTLIYVAVPALCGEGLPKIRVSSSGDDFVTEDGKAFMPFGVNYFRPGTGWAPQLWKRFEEEAVKRDFALMKQYGVNCVRVFLTYGSFFWEQDRLNEEGLAKFDRFLEIAESCGIYVHPTGPDHWEGMPEWSRTDTIADEKVLGALERFWQLFAGRYKGRAVIFAYDLRNEPSVGWDNRILRTKWNGYLRERYESAEKLAAAWQMPVDAIAWGNVPAPSPSANTPLVQLLEYQKFREEIADEWTRRQVQAIKAADPDTLVTVGLIQWSVPVLLPGVRQYAAFHPHRQARYLDFLEVHFYPLAQGFYEYSSEEAEARNLAYVEAVVREVAAAGKPVVLGEFGWYGGGKLTINEGRHPPADEEQQSRWCRAVVETTAPWTTGWLNWGLYDHPEARDVTQLTGLFTVDGKPKAWALVFRELAGHLVNLRDQAIKRAQAGPTAQVSAGLDWDRAIVDLDYAQKFRQAYYEQFLRRRP